MEFLKNCENYADISKKMEALPHLSREEGPKTFQNAKMVLQIIIHRKSKRYTRIKPVLVIFEKFVK